MRGNIDKAGRDDFGFSAEFPSGQGTDVGQLHGRDNSGLVWVRGVVLARAMISWAISNTEIPSVDRGAVVAWTA
jgi:hypothetical protein